MSAPAVVGRGSPAVLVGVVQPLRSILVLADFSPRSDNAVARAALLAREHGASLHLLHVLAPGRFAVAALRRPKRDDTQLALERARRALAALALVTLIVIATKAWTGRGTPLRGGLPSGHAAIAFAGWMAVTYIVGADEHRFIVSSIMFIMAVLVAETRVEAGFHSTLEVAYGGLLGALVTLAVFQLFFD